jgi:tetratricopeptide (TPR) repeat protein
MIQVRLSNRSAAIADYTKAVELADNNYFAFANRGSAYVDAGNSKLAKSDFEKAIALNSEFAEGYYGLARVYNLEKDFARALPMAEKAIALNAAMLPYHAAYSRTLIGLDRDNDVLAVANKMLAMDDKSSDAYLLKATAYSNLKQFDNGIATLSTAISKMPENYLLYSLRAGIYRFQHNDAAAAADDAKANQLSTK